MILRIKSWQVGGEFSWWINIFLTQPIGTDSVSSQNCIRWWTIRTFGETAAVPSFFFLPSWNKGEGCHFLFGILKGFGIPIFRSTCISFLIFFISEARSNTCRTQREAGRNIWKVFVHHVTSQMTDLKDGAFKKKKKHLLSYRYKIPITNISLHRKAPHTYTESGFVPPHL